MPGRVSRQYICHRGDFFVMIGTAPEIAKETGITTKYVYYLASATRIKKRKHLGRNGGYIIQPYEEDEYETAEY